jgi:hypothetical protein
LLAAVMLAFAAMAATLLLVLGGDSEDPPSGRAAGGGGPIMSWRAPGPPMNGTTHAPFDAEQSPRSQGTCGKGDPASTVCGDVTYVKSPRIEGTGSWKFLANSGELTGGDINRSRVMLRENSIGDDTGQTINPRIEQDMWIQERIYVPTNTIANEFPGDCPVERQHLVSPDGCGGMMHWSLRTVFNNNHASIMAVASLDLIRNGPPSKPVRFQLADNGQAMGTNQGGRGPLPGGIYGYEPWWNSPPIQGNRWYTITIRNHLSQDRERGFYEVWLDGVKQGFCVDDQCKSSARRDRLYMQTVATDTQQYPGQHGPVPGCPTTGCVATGLDLVDVGMYFQDGADPEHTQTPVIYMDGLKITKTSPLQGGVVMSGRHTIE